MFPSRKVRVISKPSKKKQSIRYNELSFESGCCVGLFNRVRSQTLGYISGTDNGFGASTIKWSVLHLYLLDEELEYAVGGFGMGFASLYFLEFNELKINPEMSTTVISFKLRIKRRASHYRHYVYIVVSSQVSLCNILYRTILSLNKVYVHSIIGWMIIGRSFLYEIVLSV